MAITDTTIDFLGTNSKEEIQVLQSLVQDLRERVLHLEQKNGIASPNQVEPQQKLFN